MNTFTVPCIHLSTYYRELKSLPIDQVTIIPFNPSDIISCEWMELIGKNLDEIIENIRISDDVNHYNRLRCAQYDADTYIDFVDLGYKLSTNITAMIAPPKTT